MPGNPAVVGYVALTDAAAWYMHVISIMLSQVPLPIDLTAIKFPEAPDVGFSARMAEKDLAEGQVRVPTATITALVQGAMTAYVQAAASGGGATALGDARAQAKRSASQSNLHQIGLAIYMWQAEHGEAGPPDLLAVVASDYIDDPAKVLVDPNDQNPRPIGSAGLKTSYEYVGSVPAKASPEVIIAYTRKGVWPEGRNVLFVDGAVAFMTEAQLQGRAPARSTLQQSYDAVVAAYGSGLTPADKARLQKFYEVKAPTTGSGG